MLIKLFSGKSPRLLIKVGIGVKGWGEGRLWGRGPREEDGGLEWLWNLPVNPQTAGPGCGMQLLCADPPEGRWDQHLTLFDVSRNEKKPGIM